MDPDAVVALASAALKRSSSHQTAELHSTPSLSALAEICVKEGVSNVAAVALKMHSPVIEIIVATNDETPMEGTIEHIRNVLQLLQNISDKRFSEGNSNVNLRKKSPPVNITEEVVPLCDELFVWIYKHSYAKVVKRHRKYWLVLDKFRNLHHEWAKTKEKDKDIVDSTKGLLGEMNEFLLWTQLINHRLAESMNVTGTWMRLG